MNLIFFTRCFPLYRFSEETTTDNEGSQTIDWSELVKAAEEAEKQLGKYRTSKISSFLLKVEFSLNVRDLI